MFLPGNNSKNAEDERQKAYTRIESWTLKKVPEAFRSDCTISVQEIKCGDPNCSPVDSAITIMFESGGQGIFGIPLEAKDVTEEEISHFAPTPDVLEKWHKGEEAEWPPDQVDMAQDDSYLGELPPVRFSVGTRVLCRVGPTSWVPGLVVQLWYREPQWPVGSWAPYKIKLNDGNHLFAPGDMDEIIRLDPSPQPE